MLFLPDQLLSSDILSKFQQKKAWSQQEQIQKICMFHSLTDEGKILWGILLVCNDQDNYITCEKLMMRLINQVKAVNLA